MSTELFVRPQPRKIDLAKTAMQAELSDNSDSWIEEILSEAHKQHPFLGRFDASVMMNEVNGEKGYGLGALLVRNKTGHLQTEAGQYLAQEAGVRTVRIPVVIREQILSDLDVFFDEKGRSFPLNERRVNEALFRPEVFDSVADAPRSDVSLASYLTAPEEGSLNRFNRGFVGDMKTASSRSLLAAIRPGMSAGDIERLETQLNQDQELASILIAKHASCFQTIASARPLTSRDVSARVYSSVRPDVVYVGRQGDTYTVKTASHRFFHPQSVHYDRLKLAEELGEPVADAVDEQGEVLVTSDPVVKEIAPEKQKPVSIEAPGQYVVVDASGHEYLGWVFPLTDFLGISIPLKVFTNGAASAIQADIMGVPAGMSTNIPSVSKLEGDGFFFLFDEEGQVQAMVPGTIRATFEDAEGPALRFETVLAEMVTLRLVAGLRRPRQMGPGKYALPATVKFCPLRGEGLQLVDSPEGFVTARDLAKAASAVEILGDGLLWSFRGRPLEGFPPEARSGLDRGQALLLSGALGMTSKIASALLDEAERGHRVRVEGCRRVTLPAERVKEAHERAITLSRELPPKCLLLKEAAELDDTDTVDKVLSLGFVTPENLSVFIEFIPDFEATVRKLAYLLTAARLGLPHVDEGLVRSAMLRLEDVLQSLKSLLHQNKN